MNDYGFELLAPRQYPFSNLIEDHIDDLLSSDQLEQDLEQALNLSELCKRRFRSIAQVAGLLVQGFPGQSKSTGNCISGSLCSTCSAVMNPTICSSNRPGMKCSTSSSSFRG